MRKSRVEYGKLNIGDELDGMTIRDFGETWVDKVAKEDHFKGQIKKPCFCGKQPVYLPSQKCEHCINRIYGESKEFCYAYFT